MSAPQLAVAFFLQMFSVLVLMAVITTVMASPVFELVYGRHTRVTVAADGAQREVGA